MTFVFKDWSDRKDVACEFEEFKQGNNRQTKKQMVTKALKNNNWKETTPQNADTVRNDQVETTLIETANEF